MFASYMGGKSKWKITGTQVKYIDEAGNEHFADHSQKECVLKMHALCIRVRTFEKQVVDFQNKCKTWRRDGFDIPSIYIPLPLQKSCDNSEDNTKCSICVQETFKFENVSTQDGKSNETQIRKAFYKMTYDDHSTTTFIVLDTLER